MKYFIDVNNPIMKISMDTSLLKHIFIYNKVYFIINNYILLVNDKNGSF